MTSSCDIEISSFVGNDAFEPPQSAIAWISAVSSGSVFLVPSRPLDGSRLISISMAGARAV